MSNKSMTGIKLPILQPSAGWIQQYVSIQGKPWKGDGCTGAGLIQKMYNSQKDEQFTRFVLKGNPFDKMIISQISSGLNLSWQISYRKMQVGAQLMLYNSGKQSHPPLYFRFNRGQKGGDIQTDAGNAEADKNKLKEKKKDQKQQQQQQQQQNFEKNEKNEQNEQNKPNEQNGYTISVVETSGKANNLRLGFIKEKIGIFLVEKNDPFVMKLRNTKQMGDMFSSLKQMANKASEQFQEKILQPNIKEIIQFQVNMKKSNFLSQCNWKSKSLAIGQQKYFIIPKQPQHSWNKIGKGNVLQLIQSSSLTDLEDFKRTAFTIEGDPFKKCVFRKFYGDKDKTLELDNRKVEEGNTVSIWNCQKRKYSASYFVINPDDDTISPIGQKGKQFCLGTDKEKNGIFLVKKDSQYALKFKRFGQFSDYYSKIQQENQVKQTKLKQNIQMFKSDELKLEFKKNGFLHLKKIIQPELVNNALRSINYLIGQCMYKKQQFPESSCKQIDVLSLFNLSAVPYLLEEFLGPSVDSRGYYVEGAQIALKYPNDGCWGNEKYDCDVKHTRQHWHIDGLPMKNSKPQFDHFGKLHTFDALIGVYLNDIPSKLNGQLCIFPESHVKLQQYMKSPENFKKVVDQGILPKNIPTSQLFGTQPTHILASSGDIIIANYMNAHFVAPNVGKDIRYACYFRVKGPKYFEKLWKQPVQDPFQHWLLPK